MLNSEGRRSTVVPVADAAQTAARSTRARLLVAKPRISCTDGAAHSEPRDDVAILVVKVDGDPIPV